MVKVKICGITNLADAKCAVGSGCNALGFVFYKKSPRYIAPLEARKIIKHLPRSIEKVGVFVNEKENKIKQIAKFCHLDKLQFHGNETPEFCRRFGEEKIIKAFRVKDTVALNKILEYKTYAWLFDTFVKSKIGGTGKSFNWRILRKIDKIKRPIFLSGGLTKNNVKRAISMVHPDWVDVSSSVEISPGKKDHQKLKKFIEAVKYS